MTELTQEKLKMRLYYFPDTGEFIWRGKGWKRADYLNSTLGYRSVHILGNCYYAHRLAFLYMLGYWPADQIDHVNRDRADNRWDNLRPATHLSNGKNQSMKSNNKSGVTGVYWYASRNKWAAEGFINGRKKFLGYFEEEDLDIAAMEVMEFRAASGYEVSHGI